MGKTRNLFKKVRDTKGLFHAKLVTIKDRNGMDLLEETLNIYLGGMFLMKPVGNCISKSRTEHSVETDRGNICSSVYSYTCNYKISTTFFRHGY